MTNRRACSLSAALFAAMLCSPIPAQNIAAEGPVATTALISVQSKQPFNAAALKLEYDGKPTDITSVMPLRSQPVEIAILIDDGLRSSFSLQLKDLQKFITSLPANASVLVGYMQNGTVRSETGFTTNHAQVASQLRIPLSTPGLSASPYFCLSEFVKHWPAEGNAARVVLMLTNGVDPYNGSVSPLNQNSPYVQAAQDDAQRAGAAVYSIYFGDAGIRGGLASFSGQGYLQQVADATGGQSYNQFRGVPSIGPFLNQFRTALAESYLLTFKVPAEGERKPKLERLKVKSEQGGVKVYAPQGVVAGVGGSAGE